MESANTGGAAFPSYEWDEHGDEMQAIPGMTLRDYFAGKALTIANDNLVRTSPVGVGRDEDVARLAYRYADAMLAARSA